MKICKSFPNSNKLTTWYVLKKTVITYFLNLLGFNVKTVSFTAGFELEFDVLIKNIYPTIFLLCKNTLSQSSLMIDVICYDYLKGERRFMLIYNLLSVKFNTRFRVRSRVSNTDNLVSLISLYKSVGWSEREVFDFFGLFFFENRDLRRILTDYAFKGYPLRKDFPITGFVGSYYDDSQKLICYEGLELSQEYRNFKLN